MKLKRNSIERFWNVGWDLLDSWQVLQDFLDFGCGGYISLQGDWSWMVLLVCLTLPYSEFNGSITLPRLTT